MFTSSFRFDTSKTFENPLNAAGFAEPKAPVVAKANAPRLGIPPPPYAPPSGVPSPRANGGKTPVPKPLTAKIKCSDYFYVPFIGNILIFFDF